MVILLILTSAPRVFTSDARQITLYHQLNAAHEQSCIDMSSVFTPLEVKGAQCHAGGICNPRCVTRP